MKKVNENVQPTTDEYTLFIPGTENYKNIKLCNMKKQTEQQKESHFFKGTQRQHFSFKTLRNCN